MALLFSRSASPHHGFAAYYTYLESIFKVTLACTFNQQYEDREDHASKLVVVLCGTICCRCHHAACASGKIMHTLFFLVLSSTCAFMPASLQDHTWLPLSHSNLYLSKALTSQCHNITVVCYWSAQQALCCPYHHHTTATYDRLVATHIKHSSASFLYCTYTATMRCNSKTLLLWFNSN